MKTALVYDRVNKWGGAERVLLALRKIFPEAPLYTSVYNKKTSEWAKVFNIKTSFLQNFPYAPSSHELYATLMPMAFESFNFNEFDLVISVTSEAAKGVITTPKTKHICYLLTPTRYLWSGYEDYFRNPVLRFISKPVIKYLRNWDVVSANRPDKLIVLSNEVKKRVKKYYKKESEVVYPPIENSTFNIKNSKPEQKDDYFLVVSRLVYYKRIDLAIEAFNQTRYKLKIVGTGGEFQNLKKIAKENIEFLGNLTEEKLSYYYKNCKALIFPGLEDFGLVMAEAQSFGKPVIAFRGGGALDIVKEGITGEFFDLQTPQSLLKALSIFDSKRYNEILSRQNAEKFSFENFKTEILKSISTI